MTASEEDVGHNSPDPGPGLEKFCGPGPKQKQPLVQLIIFFEFPFITNHEIAVKQDKLYKTF
jgi:hypothetical protein